MLAFFINSKRSYHGVTPRSASRYPRRLINVIAEVPYVSEFSREASKALNKKLESKDFHKKGEKSEKSEKSEKDVHKKSSEKSKDVNKKSEKGRH